MTDWRFIDSGPGAASHNMAIDEAIAVSVRKGDAPATLRIYGWDRPSVSLGSFQKITDVNIDFCSANNIPVVRRPTGGRAILHYDELTYSFSSASNGTFSGGLLDSYMQLGVALKSALEVLGLPLAMKTERERGQNLARSPLCFGSTSYGEITFKGRKLVGSAQKRWKDGFLQQGSVPYSIDGENMKRIFAHGSSGNSNSSIMGLREVIACLDTERLKEAVRLAFEDAFRIKLTTSALSPEELLLAREVETRKYLSREWTFQR